MPQPVEIKLRTESSVLDVHFDDGSSYELTFEYLRVFSPSAEVKGHGGGEGTLQTGKERVGITGVEPIGNYAVRLLFDDGHNTGLYSWDLLHELGRDAATNWARYLKRCTAAGVRRGGGRGAGRPRPRGDRAGRLKVALPPQSVLNTPHPPFPFSLLNCPLAPLHPH